MKQYKQLVNDILTNGKKRTTRNGHTVISQFNYNMSFNMKDGFPLQTTKKLSFHNIYWELIWFLRGDTNIKFLLDKNVNIWNADCYRQYVERCSSNSSRYTQWMNNNEDGTLRMYRKDEFIDLLKTDPTFCNHWGNLGNIYGKQWRRWKQYEYSHSTSSGDVFDINYIDQIQNIIDLILHDPTSRRMILNSWNVSDISTTQYITDQQLYNNYVNFTKTLLEPDDNYLKLDMDKSRYCVLSKEEFIERLNQDDIYDEWFRDKFGRKRSNSNMALTPCHTLAQFYVDEQYLDCSVYIRSNDIFLGCPYNIASYSLLLYIIAKITNKTPRMLYYTIGDAHIYTEHIEQCNIILDRTEFKLPQLELKRNFNSLEDLINNETIIYEVTNYKHHKSLKAKLLV